jgi:hypothetical protein
VSKSKLLDNVSGKFFLFGFIIGKLRSVPVPIVSIYAVATSVLSYFIAHGLWFISSHHYPEHKAHEEWYGFTHFKGQNKISAVLGVTAAALNIAGLFFGPVMVIPAMWLYFAGNVVWTIAEYHKFKNPHADEDYSHHRQKSQVPYAIATTAVGLITAISTSLVFIFPVIAMPIFAVGMVLTLGLGALSTEYWLEANMNKHAPTPIKALESYVGMNESLGKPEKTTIHCGVEPSHYSDPLKSKKAKSKCIELNPESPQSISLGLGTII